MTKLEIRMTNDPPKLFLRIGLAFVFLYAAIASLLEPQSWIGFFPLWLKNLIKESVLLPTFSVYEILLGLWLLWGKKTFWAALLSAATLFGILIFNLKSMDIVFRDIGLFFSALALATLNRYERQTPKT